MVLGLIGNIAGNLNQDKFVEGAEAENRLQALQRANFTRDQERLALQNLVKPTLPTAPALTQGSAGLSLEGFGGEYITVPPPVEKKKPEVVVPESKTIIPPFTFGYCFNFQKFFSFLTNIISPIRCLSVIDFLFGIDHLIFV